MLPTLSRARERAYTTVCKSNLRQLSIAIANYAADFHAYPYYSVGASTPGSPDNSPYWQELLQPYSGASWDMEISQGRANFKSQLYLCPSYARLGPFYGSPDMWSLGHHYGCYGYNWRGVWKASTSLSMGLGGGWAQTTAPEPPTRESEVLRPSAMIALGDGPLAPTVEDPVRIYGWSDYSRYEGFQDYAIGQDTNGLPEMGYWTPAGKQFVLSAIRKRHLNRWNVAYSDGHVLTQKTREIFDYTDDEVLRLRNKDNLPHRELLQIGP